MRIAILQLAFNTGDFAGNNQKLLTAYQAAVAQGAQLVLTADPSGTDKVTGTMLLSEGFARRCQEQRQTLARDIGAIPLGIYGGDGQFNIRLDLLHQGNFNQVTGTDYTTCTLAGRQLGLHHLTINEKEFFNPADNLSIYFYQRPLYPQEPAQLTAFFSKLAQAAGHPVLLINALGGYDATVYNGFSLAIDAAGQILAQSHCWTEETLLFDLPENGTSREGAAAAGDARNYLQDYLAHQSFESHYILTPADTDRKEWQQGAVETLCYGLREYVRKCGFKKVLVGLSGGIDSALVATLAVRTLGAENVHGITMPSRYSPDDSPNDAAQLAANLGLAMDTIPIEPIFAPAMNSLTPVLGNPPWGLAQENLQARLRGTILMTYSNKNGHLVLATGNKSELSVGYATLYGDTCGGLELIGDVYKTDVYKLCHFLNAEAGRELIPYSTLTKPPSAELAPGQKDQDSLPPYPELDAILRLFIEKLATGDEIIAAGHDPEVVKRVLWLVKRAEYKRGQAAPVINISGHAFGCNRSYPIAHAYMG